MAIVRRELKVKARGHGQWFGTAKIARWSVCFLVLNFAFSALTLLVGRQEGHPVCKNCVVGAGVVIRLERRAYLHMAQLMPLPLTVSCFSKIQIGFTFLVPAFPGSPGKKAVKRVCVCVCVLVVYKSVPGETLLHALKRQQTAPRSGHATF